LPTREGGAATPSGLGGAREEHANSTIGGIVILPEIGTIDVDTATGDPNARFRRVNGLCVAFELFHRRTARAGIRIGIMYPGSNIDRLNQSCESRLRSGPLLLLSLRSTKLAR
jgi:hypothetical protein